MDPNQEKTRAAIAAEAGEWFVINNEGPLSARDSAALTAWLKASPVHIEEFLGVAAVAKDLKQARIDPEYSLEAILGRARVEAEAQVQSLWPPVIEAARGRPTRRWLPAAVALAACALLSVGLLLRWNVSPTRPPVAPERIATVDFATRHGEQLTRRLADNSVLHLNTDSAVTVRYSKGDRLVTLKSGQATFEVAHEANRAFRVYAGAAEIIDLGTRFDVRLDGRSTVVTVVEGRVVVGAAAAGQSRALRPIELKADQQIRVAEGTWPAAPVAVDAEQATAWLHREIVFDNEPLERVAAEYNRYAAKPFEIATPALRNLRISGVFATDDAAAFIAFLRSLKGVRVDVTETRVLVSKDQE